MATEVVGYVVIDREDNLWGPFEGSYEGVHWAATKWPDQKQVERASGDSTSSGLGWDVWPIHKPD